MNKTITHFDTIILNSTPLIDVRSPSEYENGSFLNTVNLPILTDQERVLVGICYKEKGNEEAMKLGYKLVSGKAKEDRIGAWINQIKICPSSILFCYRGGNRSQIAQEWITEATGNDILRLHGGYKAFRNHLINALNPEQITSHPILISGNTGSGKTKLLKQLNNSIDLEGIANHRGSSFGKFITPQPSQINFENNLAYTLIKHKHKGYKQMILEDEGRNIGRVNIPKPFHDYISTGKLVLIEEELQTRTQNTYKEYVLTSQTDYTIHYGSESGLTEWFNYILNSIKRIEKRLGGMNYKRVLDSFEKAFQEQIQTGKTEAHIEWIELLLKEYYDPMYQYQIKKSNKEVIFKGNLDEALYHLNKCYSDIE